MFHFSSSQTQASTFIKCFTYKYILQLQFQIGLLGRGIDISVQVKFRAGGWISIIIVKLSSNSIGTLLFSCFTKDSFLLHGLPKRHFHNSKHFQFINSILKWWFLLLEAFSQIRNYMSPKSLTSIQDKIQILCQLSLQRSKVPKSTYRRPKKKRHISRYFFGKD